jgi:hypothetical protein
VRAIGEVLMADEQNVSVPLDMAKLDFKVKVPEGCQIVLALRLPSGQLVELDDLLESQEGEQVSSVEEFAERRESIAAEIAESEARMPRAPSALADIQAAAEAQVAAEAAEIDPDREVGLLGGTLPNLKRVNDVRGEPVEVQMATVADWLGDYLRRRDAGHETCVADDPMRRCFGYVDYTDNEYMPMGITRFRQTWDEMTVGLAKQLGFADMEELKKALVDNRGREKLFGAWMDGSDAEPPDVVEVLQTIWSDGNPPEGTVPQPEGV